MPCCLYLLCRFERSTILQLGLAGPQGNTEHLIEEMAKKIQKKGARCEILHLTEFVEKKIILEDIQEKLQKADGFVSIAGPGQRASQTLRVQLEKQPIMIKNEAYRVIDSLEKGVIVKDVNPLLTTLFRESVQPYLISWFKYEPCAEIRKLKTPVLILQGDADLQVKVWDAERLHVCNMNSQMDIIDDMNHVLKVLSSPDDMNENIASYSNPNLPISARMMAIITEFINRNN
mgnify:CR=1 FL=1